MIQLIDLSYIQNGSEKKNMKNFIISVISLTLVFTSMIFAQNDIKNIKLDEEFSLAVKQKGFLKNGKLTIEFVSVLEDSRCPVDVDCVWAGNAKIQIKISKGKMAAQIFEVNTNLEPQIINFQGYKIQLTKLLPAPKSNVDMKTVSYSASFMMRK